MYSYKIYLKMVMNNKKGAQGIGTLIIFIAMILVAAVAAGVLIQTASSLQSKSLDVGRQSQEKIATNIDVVQVYASGTNDSIIGSTDEFTMVVRLGSGSAAVKLSDLLVKLDTKAGSQAVSYTSGSTANQTAYTVAYLSNGAKATTPGYLSNGDLAQITFVNENEVKEGQSATVRLLTKNGAVKPVDLTTPSAMTQSVTYLFP